MKIEFFSDSDRAAIISKNLDVPVEIINSDKGCKISFDIDPNNINIVAMTLFHCGCEYAINEAVKAFPKSYHPSEFK
jgi:hypothetical protein